MSPGYRHATGTADAMISCSARLTGDGFTAIFGLTIPPSLSHCHPFRPNSRRHHQGLFLTANKDRRSAAPSIFTRQASPSAAIMSLNLIFGSIDQSGDLHRTHLFGIIIRHGANRVAQTTAMDFLCHDATRQLARRRRHGTFPFSWPGRGRHPLLTTTGFGPTRLWGDF